MTSIKSEILIDANILRKNIKSIKNKLQKKSKFMAVIKSDAYGHNLSSIVKDIDDLVDGYGVVRIEEAMEIRKKSKKKVLLMQGIYSEDEYILSKNQKLDLVIHNNNQFNLIKGEENHEMFWYKVNTGMNRLGFEISDFIKIYEKYLKEKKFTLMSHLASSNDKESPANENQFKLFNDLSSQLNKNIKKSIANTGCVMNFPEFSLDWVRCGIGIYGGYLKDDQLETAMTLRSPIINIRSIKKGDKVGYDGRAVAKYDMKIASVYLGYADGLPVTIKDGTSVMVNDQIAKVFGKVSMDLTTIDVTNIANCRINDWCEFFSPKLPISNISKSNDLITYYFMTNIKSRVKKVYKSID
tara:strand:+ start:1443 stop:2504 length:1062 start_codon:yes stop_codon:yes gene_type:complete